jgi:hypothetical protein
MIPIEELRDDDLMLCVNQGTVGAIELRDDDDADLVMNHTHVVTANRALRCGVSMRIGGIQYSRSRYA